MSTIQADFDDLALLPADKWDHNTHYHEFLLRQVPSPCRQSLEIGCGTGAFSRLLAGRSDQVLALDLSQNMIRIAKEQSSAYPNVDFLVTDVMDHEFEADQFDCIVSIATLHHLPTEAAVRKITRALKVNGVLLILDLFQADGIFDAFRSAVALPASMAVRLTKGSRIVPPRRVRAAWAKHGRNDSYLSLKQVHELCSALLPGAEVKSHLFWRYSVIWKKPATV
ncbi:MAG TPA: class I SAM-dependent methyltransferase [Pyrinomonadaceae bacterium]|nr:class I SAM-dependent methyltransferase [Pyrinomonadaceae bacterium]